MSGIEHMHRDPRIFLSTLRGLSHVHRLAADQERSRPAEGTPQERLTDRQFDLLEVHDPHQLRITVLGTALASGVFRERHAYKKIVHAADIAEFAHRDDVRKVTGDKYIVHSYRSALIAMELATAQGIPITTELVNGAILHDGGEDHPDIVSSPKLYLAFKRFGHDYAARIVDDARALNRNADGKQLSQEEYIQSLTTVTNPTSPHEIPASLLRRLIIKTADRRDSLLDPPWHPRSEAELRLRKRIIGKTNDDLIPLLTEEYPTAPIQTGYLLGVINDGLAVSQTTLNQPDFDPKKWRAYAAAMK